MEGVHIPNVRSGYLTFSRLLNINALDFNSIVDGSAPLLNDLRAGRNATLSHLIDCRCAYYHLNCNH